ncbi:MAG: polymer-forming cytoskeletal protein [Oscillospiraceae bacterium]|nr:polymer-forming cytoskeletal protein [Oscillospiraceae bacterium]
MKKIVSILLTAVLFCTSLVVFAQANRANDITVITAAITSAVDSYNRRHGGVGELRFDYLVEGGSLVGTISGMVTGATREFYLPIPYPDTQTNIFWNARLSGSTEQALLRSHGRFILSANAEVINQAPNGSAIESHEVVVHGFVSATQAITATNLVTVTGGGIVHGNITAAREVAISGSGTAAQGNIITTRLNVHAGAGLHAPSVQAASVEVLGTSNVLIDNTSGLQNAIITLANTAQTNIIATANNYILRRGNLWEVMGQVTFDGQLEIGAGETFWIGENDSLTVEALQMLGGFLVIDGTLNLPADFDFSDWQGQVSGANAGELAGNWPRPVEGACCENAWYNAVPNWVHWMLRWIFFGWLWMCC